VDYVADRLTNSVYYRSDTKAFRDAMKRGQDRDQAVLDWLKGIADPYNYRPQTYVSSITKLMNDPIRPSSTRNPSRSLFDLR
jgi:hypothetical protein